MKSKKLLISLMAVAIVVVIIVILLAVLTVKEVVPIYHGFDGTPISAPSDGIASDDLEAMYRGKSILVLSESKLMAELNEKYPYWHTFDVVRSFPNIVEIHFVRRTAIAKFTGADGAVIYVDGFGYVTPVPEKEEEESLIDITSAFQTIDVSQHKEGSKLIFESEESDRRLNCVLEAIIATWRCWVEIEDISPTLGAKDVFSFNVNGDFVISPKSKGKIVVESPETDLSERLIDAYSVYFSGNSNLYSDDFIITVSKNGRISSPSK